MPLKYLAGMPMAVKVAGWTHGMLFVIFCGLLLHAMVAARWSLPRAAVVFISALLPFGPFLLDSRMKEYQREFENDRAAQSPR